MSSAPGLKGKTLFITGASRGIGLAIATRAAADGANIVIIAKTTETNPKLPGTIYTAAEAVNNGFVDRIAVTAKTKNTYQHL